MRVHSHDETILTTRGRGSVVKTNQKLALIHKHLDAEGAGDIETACSVYADDIEHDAVGFQDS